MEVLNRNQRRSAIWRLMGLGLLILMGVSTVLYSAHQKYAGQGQGDIEMLKKKHKQETKSWIAKNTDLQNKNRALQKQIESLKGSKGSPNAQLQALENRLQSRQDRIRDLEEDLTRCTNRLTQISSN